MIALLSRMTTMRNHAITGTVDGSGAGISMLFHSHPIAGKREAARRYFTGPEIV
jgi:hypothetical protein